MVGAFHKELASKVRDRCAKIQQTLVGRKGDSSKMQVRNAVSGSWGMPGSGRDAWLSGGEGGRSGGPGEFPRLVGTDADTGCATGWRLPSQDAASQSVRVESGCRGPSDSLQHVDAVNVIP